MNKTVLKNIISGLLSQFTTIVYGLIIPIMIIKKFGSNVNGFIASVTQFIAYINLLQLGIGPIIKNALFKPIANNDREKIGEILSASNRFFKKIAYALIFYIIILCMIFPLINNEFDTVYSISLIIIIALGTFFEYFLGMTYKLFLTSNQKNYIVDIVNIFGYLLSVILVYLLINLEFSIHIVKLVGSIIFIIKPLLLKMYFDKKMQIKINKNSNYKFKNKFDGFVHHIAATIQDNTDVVILTVFSTLQNVSIYTVYSLIVHGIQSIIVSLTNGIDGYFGKLMVKDNDSVKRKFDIYNFFFYTITTILVSCMLLLITPFVTIYTKDIVDANYVQPLFGYILAFSEFNYVIRYPYSTLVYSKGDFKQTSKYAIIEPIVNIIVSSILVIKYGLIGVAIGTMVSMPIRSFGFIYHGIKYILKDGSFKYLKIIFISYVELIIVFLIRNKLMLFDINNYFSWILLAFSIFIIITVVISATNWFLFGKKIFRRE